MTAAEAETAVGRLEDRTEGENVFDQESSTRGVPAELLPKETEPTSAVALKEKQSVLATLSKHREDPMEKTIALHPPAKTIEQQKPRLRLPLRMNAPRIPYPEKIDIELPASFSNDPANHGAGSEGKKRKRNSQGLWLTEVVTPLPAGWHPDLIILRHRAPSSSPVISTRYHRVAPTLLQLPTELRIHILRYLLKSSLPMTNPHIHCQGASEGRSIRTVHVHILRTCRRIYLEGSPILYQENTFRFTEWSSWFSFKFSSFPIHRDGIRHLEIHTTVAERYCHRAFHVPGVGIVADMRTRGPVGWDWPWESPWHFPNLRTLKLELDQFELLPDYPDANTPHFRPDPMTTEGRDALLTKLYVIRHIHGSCQTPGLRALTVLGILSPNLLLLLEVHFLKDVWREFRRHCTRYQGVVQYLENRTGGRWETQSQRAEGYWRLTHTCRDKRIEEGWQPKLLTKDYCLPGREVRHLALLMWIRMRAAKHGLTDPPTTKPATILWTW